VGGARAGGAPRWRIATRGEECMGKTKVAISAIVLGLVIGSTGVASANPGAVSECSPAFVGMDIQTVIDTIAAPDFDPQAFPPAPPECRSGTEPGI
jgi:hypothetical protein